MSENQDLQSKKDKIMGNKKKKPNFLLFGFLGILVLIVIVVFNFTGKTGTKTAQGGNYNAGSVSYEGKKIEMTSVKPEVSGDTVSVKLSDIKKNSIERFEVPGATMTLESGEQIPFPLATWVAPDGRIVVATSVCEPCSGTTFHIDGDKLVCNTCGTRWYLSDLSGIDGGCPNYPPAEIKYQVQGDKVVVNLADVKAWKPRTVNK